MFGPVSPQPKAAEPAQIQEAEFSINRASELLGVDRRTVKKKIASSGVRHKGTLRGFKIYFLGDVARACFLNEQVASGYEVEKLGPKERAEHFMAEKRELEVLEKKRELIPYDEAAEKYAELGQTFSKFFPTFIDDLEQTGLFSTEQLEMMQDFCDQQRDLFAEQEF